MLHLCENSHKCSGHLHCSYPQNRVYLKLTWYIGTYWPIHNRNFSCWLCIYDPSTEEILLNNRLTPWPPRKIILGKIKSNYVSINRYNFLFLCINNENHPLSSKIELECNFGKSCCSVYHLWTNFRGVSISGFCSFLPWWKYNSSNFKYRN